MLELLQGLGLQLPTSMRRIPANAIAGSRIRFCRSVPNPKIHIYDIGIDEKVSSEALEAARIACNEYMTKFAGIDALHQSCERESFPCVIKKMLSCAGVDRHQTGMRDASGEPHGVFAKVSIGQVLMSVRCKEKNIAHGNDAGRCA